MYHVLLYFDSDRIDITLLYVVTDESIEELIPVNFGLPSCSLWLHYSWQVQLQTFVKEKTRSCQHSVFIFDEVDFFPPGLINSVQSFLDYRDEIDGVDFRNTIFLLLRWVNVSLPRLSLYVKVNFLKVIIDDRSQERQSRFCREKERKAEWEVEVERGGDGEREEGWRRGT